MAKTDRQTDKAIWWSVTAFNDEIAILTDKDKWPVEVHTVYGGLEECPDTGRKHFQGAIRLNKQQRLSWFKSWLPTAHLEVARSKDALIKYAMKEDTAIGEKTQQENGVLYVRAEQICLLLVGAVYDDYRQLDMMKTDDKDFIFWIAVNRLLSKDMKLAGQLMNPSLRSWFRNTKHTWYSILREQRENADHESVISHA